MVTKPIGFINKNSLAEFEAMPDDHLCGITLWKQRCIDNLPVYLTAAPTHEELVAVIGPAILGRTATTGADAAARAVLELLEGKAL